MKTQTLTKDKSSHSTNVKTVNQNEIILKDAEYKQVSTSEIDFSPMNYRKFISEDALQQFADELKQHGILSSLIIRPISANRYELVAGERRLRAARIAKLQSVPAAIINLNDEQVVEIQLSENLQRENPHPLHEGQAIGQMQHAGKSIDEISIRLGKSKQFIYSRLKLLSLIEAFQEMVFADVISLQDALQIAAISKTSQAEFFEEHCSKWQKDKHFSLYNLEYYLNQYRYDLKKAPFNIKDKSLVPEAGSCNGCPSNSASLKTLFPEYAKQAVCSNKECYNKKCSVHLVGMLQAAIDTYQPEAILYLNHLSEISEVTISLTPEASILPKYNYHDVTVITKPETPDKEDYTYDDEVEEDEYNSAMEDYYRDLEIYNLHVQSGQYKIALMQDNRTFEPVYFSMDKPKNRNGDTPVNAKGLQAAIKSGTVTIELLQSEIERLDTKEKRAKEIDKEKVQLLVHQELTQLTAIQNEDRKLTMADEIAARLLIYQSLDYSSRRVVNETLFSKMSETSPEITFYEQLAGLTESQYSFLIRMTIAGKADSKFPHNDTGKILYKVAEEAGVNVQLITEGQEQKRKEREDKYKNRIKELETKMEKLKEAKI
jgi:ParB/RepB/Spo0J family partition protein